MTATLAPKLCECDGCDRNVSALGLCAAHYMRYRSHGASFDPSPIRDPGPWVNGGACSVEACDRTARVAGLCPTHYQRGRVGGDIRSDVPIIDQDFDSIGFCACPSPQPQQVRLWDTVLIDAYQCVTCRRGIRSVA